MPQLSPHPSLALLVLMFLFMFMLLTSSSFYSPKNMTMFIKYKSSPSRNNFCFE
uniref:ATP synthase subunit 8 n=1 Tax=Microceramus pontificus TaxID=513540 RepID=A0A343F269_9EUPU|nr:ATP synthase F0 subunit 8 [Microceramus pontificus]ASP44439.1 ATP synthase subunit 8 [Microceramus pontificus]